MWSSRIVNHADVDPRILSFKAREHFLRFVIRIFDSCTSRFVKWRKDPSEDRWWITFCNTLNCERVPDRINRFMRCQSDCRLVRSIWFINNMQNLIVLHINNTNLVHWINDFNKLLFYFIANELRLIGIFFIQVLVLGKITGSNKAQWWAKLIRLFSWKCIYILYIEKFG